MFTDAPRGPIVALVIPLLVILMLIPGAMRTRFLNRKAIISDSGPDHRCCYQHGNIDLEAMTFGILRRVQMRLWLETKWLQ